MSAYIGLGITEGAKKVQEHERGRAVREAQQAEALNRKQLSELELSEYKRNAPLREQETELAIAQARQETRAANLQNLTSINFTAFDKYEADGDVRHLNNMLVQVKKNPIGARANSPIVRFDELTDTPDVRQMMIDGGFTDFDGILNDPDMKKNFVVTTDNQGQKMVYDVNKMYGATGYAKHMKKEQLDLARQKLEMTNLLKQGNSLSQVQMKNQVVESMMAAEKIPRHEAWRRVTEIEKGGSQGQDLQAIKAIQEEKEGRTMLEATQLYYQLKNSGKGQTDQSRFIDSYMAENPGATSAEASAAYRNLTKTTKSKNVAEVDQYKDELDEMNFLELDMSTVTPQERANIHRKVSKIEELLDVNLTTEDKRVMRDLNNLTKLGATAGTDLTSDETGLMDSMLNSVKKYMFNEVGGAKATSAYETFRNIFRNSLYGASLTENEIKAFNAAAGTLGQKFQPALARLNTQMMSIKSQLESIRDTNDPYVAKFYLGKDIDSIDDAIRQIDSRLDLVSQYKPKNSITTKDVIDKDSRPPLDEILGGL